MVTEEETWAELPEEEAELLTASGLTHRQQLFCLYYARSFNASKAYRMAYDCGKKTAGSGGSRLLANPRVGETVEKLKRLRMGRTLLTMPDVVRRYMDIAFADITDFLTFGPEEVPDRGKDADPEHPYKVVDAVHLKPWDQVDGQLIAEVAQSSSGVRLKLFDPMKALQWLADYLREEEAARGEDGAVDDPITRSLKEAMAGGVFSKTDGDSPLSL